MNKKFDASMNILKASFLENKTRQIEVKVLHEKSRNFGMAYLAVWFILESFAREVAPLCRCVELKSLLNEWMVFLSEPGKVRPKNISIGKFEVDKKMDKIPPRDILMILIDFDSAKNFYEIINSDERYRRRRNAIAHSGVGPSEAVYDEFNQKALMSINEIEIWLAKNSS